MEVLWFAGILLLVGFVVWIGWYLSKKRREEMQAFATRNRLQYSRADPFNLLAWPFTIFGLGAARGVENVVWGSWQGGEPVTAFDYWYYTESTDSKGNRNRHYRRFSCAQIEVPAAFPALQVARENLFTRMADGMGLADIEFELPEFNRRYNVKGADRKFAYEILDARMIDWLVKGDAGFAFEIVGNRILAYRRRIRGGGLEPLVGTLLRFRDHIPQVAWSLHPKA